jgi:Uma2 family endonuclease
MGLRAYEEHYTYEDYERWEGDWEIIDGFPYAMSPKPMIKHQQTSGNIYAELREKNNCEKCLVAIEIDYKMADDTIVSPDVLVACGENLGEKYLQKTPQIIFEILSPSTEKKDRNEKYSLYEEAGVQYYVIVDSQSHTAEIYTLQNGSYKEEKRVKNDAYTFTIDACEIAFEFQKIWVK